MSLLQLPGGMENITEVQELDMCMDFLKTYLSFLKSWVINETAFFSNNAIMYQFPSHRC